MSSAQAPIDAPLVTIATFGEPADASLARGVLESAGIIAFLRSANANSMLPVAFESELQVRAEDEAAARAALAEIETSPASLDDVTAAEQQDEAEDLPGESTED